MNLSKHTKKWKVALIFVSIDPPGFRVDLYSHLFRYYMSIKGKNSLFVLSDDANKANACITNQSKKGIGRDYIKFLVVAAPFCLDFPRAL